MRTGEIDRCYGIDLLKTISMFLVVILHIMGQGGVLGVMTPYSAKFWVAWFIEIAAYCAIHCFGIATGYLMVGRTFKYRKILYLGFVK